MIIYYTDKYTGSREDSRRLLRKALAVHTGDEQKAKTLAGALKKGEHGKPFIDGFSCFSISHTGNIWAILFAESECGLDIQFGRKCDMKAIAERWFDPEDAAGTAALSDERSSEDAFFMVWTRREALTKALGGTVYDTGLPAVMEGEADIGGRHYSLADVVFPSLEDAGLPRLYAAVCVEGSLCRCAPEIRVL